MHKINGFKNFIFASAIAQIGVGYKVDDAICYFFQFISIQFVRTNKVRRKYWERGFFCLYAFKNEFEKKTVVRKYAKTKTTSDDIV